MKQKFKICYETPCVKIIEIEVEKGFASSILGEGEEGETYNMMFYDDYE